MRWRENKRMKMTQKHYFGIRNNTQNYDTPHFLEQENADSQLSLKTYIFSIADTPHEVENVATIVWC